MHTAQPRHNKIYWVTGLQTPKHIKFVWDFYIKCERGGGGFLGNQEPMWAYFVISKHDQCYGFTNAVYCFMIVHSTILSIQFG